MAKSKRSKESEEKLDSTSITKKFSAALGKTVDFSRMERFLSEAINRFKEQSYNTATQTARESVLRIRGKLKDYLEVNWAVAILSMSRMLETSNKASKLANEGKRRLQDSVDAFMDGTFVETPEVLEKLADAAANLYAFEMDMAREHVAAQSRALKEVQAMGGDIGAASTVLSRAAEALAEDDWAGYLDLIAKADNLVEQAKETRVAEIKQSASLMASKFLDDVRQAIQTGDFVAANYLVNVADQNAPGTQVPTADKVTLMKDRMVRKVRKFIGQIGPLIEKAKKKGFEADRAQENLQAAEQLLKTGDYVNALMVAKKSYQAVRKYRSELEGEAILDEFDAPTPEVEEAPPKEEKKGKKKEAKGKKEDAKKAEKAEKPKVEEELEDLIEEPVLWCTRCGSVNIGEGEKGEAKCLDCGEKLTLVGRAGT